MTIKDWLLRKLPQGMRADDFLQELFGAGAKGLDGLADSIRDIYYRTSFDRLEEPSCYYWEELLGLSHVGPLEARRSSIRAAWLAGEPPTVALLQQAADAFENGSIDVSYNAAAQTVTFTFSGAGGIPAEEDRLKAAIGRICPAHLLTLWAYLYLTCAEVNGMKCSAVNSTALTQFAGRGMSGDVG